MNVRVGPIKATGVGLGVVLLVLLGAAILLALGGLFWGWIAMLIWPLFGSAIGFGVKTFWVGVIVTFVLGILSGD